MAAYVRPAAEGRNHCISSSVRMITKYRDQHKAHTFCRSRNLRCAWAAAWPSVIAVTMQTQAATCVQSGWQEVATKDAQVMHDISTPCDSSPEAPASSSLRWTCRLRLCAEGCWGRPNRRCCCAGLSARPRLMLHGSQHHPQAATGAGPANPSSRREQTCDSMSRCVSLLAGIEHACNRVSRR